MRAPTIGFDEAADIVWAGRERLPQHPNALTFTAYDAAGAEIASRGYFSIGGGFVRDEEEMGRNAADGEDIVQPFPFESAAELLDICAREGLTIAELMLANETAVTLRPQVEARLDGLFDAMEACIDRGLRIDGELPGGPEGQAAGHADPRLHHRQGRARPGRSSRADGLRQSLGPGRERGERRRRPRRDGADQWRGGHHPGGAQVL